METKLLVAGMTWCSLYLGWTALGWEQFVTVNHFSNTFFRRFFLKGQHRIWYCKC